MDKVLVTGANGFVGSHLVNKLLGDGLDVVALVRDGLMPPCTVINGHLESLYDVERALDGVGTVFHLGAQALVGTALRNPLLTFESNIRGTYNLLEACRRQGTQRIVIASSDKAYGDSDLLPYTEDMPVCGKHPYDVSKSCADLLAQTYAHTYGMNVGIARCGNIYGPGDLNWSRIVPGTIRSVYEGKNPVLRSDGTFVRDYIHVSDVVNGYILLADHLGKDGMAGQAFNFGPYDPMTVLEIANKVIEAMKSQLKPIIMNETINEIHSQYLDSTLAKNILGWEPKISLEKGISQTIPWYLNHLDHL